MVSSLYVQVTDMEGTDLPMMSTSAEFITAFMTAVQESETLVPMSANIILCLCFVQ